MQRIPYLVLGNALVACLIGAPRAFAAEEGTSEKFGQQVDRAVDQVQQEARKWAEEMREGFEQMRARVERMGVAARVYARLHWDKALVQAPLSVDVQKDGVAVLSGTVANEPAKAKAETLAKDTVGIERVVNNLQVQPPPGKGL